MRRVVIVGFVLGLSLIAPPSYGRNEAESSPCGQTPQRDPNSVEAVLDGLQAKAADLTSYRCVVDYVFKQPLLESQTRRKGTLDYAKTENRSHLRIDFNTLQYDQEKEQKHKEQFLFDGIWGTYIDYQSRSVQRQQVAEPNAPVDAFALVSRRVPVLGFSKVEDLQKQFVIQLAPRTDPGSPPSHWLHLEVKPGSDYHDDYVTIDVQIDKQHGLPIMIVAVTTEQDVHEIKLADPKINQAIARGRFDVEIPSDFSVETVPLQRDTAHN